MERENINQQFINDMKKKMTKKEKKIYDAILKAFPKTHPDSAYECAINGGAKFQFIYK